MIEVTFHGRETPVKKKVPEKIWEDFWNKKLQFFWYEEGVSYKYKDSEEFIKI